MARRNSSLYYLASRRNAGLGNTPETLYARAKCAQWLLALAQYDVSLDESYFECLEWSLGTLRPLLKKITEAVQKIKSPDDADCEAVCRAAEHPGDRPDRTLAELVENNPSLQSIVYPLVMQACADFFKPTGKTSNSFSKARAKLKNTFGLSDEACILCEFVFINQSFSHVERYFEDSIDIHQFGHRRLMAHMLNINSVMLRNILTELTACGILDMNHRTAYRLQDELLPFWEEDKTEIGKIFCRPLEGNSPPLKSFAISKEEIAYAKDLLTLPGDDPVHILLYGKPGTGKTSFAKSLAAALDIKAWIVSSRENDDDKDRRASLTACLHIAGKHKGSFVLVDEAERLLDTDRYFGRATKDKAWLNDFLEQPGKRIIWITNQIEHIDQAVRRRFSFSIHFDDLGNLEREEIWRQVLANRKVTNRLSEQQLHIFSKDYDVPAAVIEKSVAQAKRLGGGKKEFGSAVEQALRAHLTLSRNGNKPRIKPQPSAEYTLDGVCMEGSAAELLRNCRRIDSLLRCDGHLRPGGGTMLFYGPPGTGKTALARYIAKELDRECVVKRASDLLSPWVGVAEQQVADAFQQAESKGTVLVIDEADSFIYSRDIAQRSWETTLVNEFLTGLEECRSFCICTTNRRDNMDVAAMRRFSFKVPFTYAKPEQIGALYASLLAPLVKSKLKPEEDRELRAMSRLAPGDFHAVRSQYWLAEPEAFSHKELLNALRSEQKMKLDGTERQIGF
jgi:SpoVK/Ycf46/Vps4 family AAA+-type ATPase